ncbi:MAG TPA: hypothetical protein VKI44_34200 [Acetobacteraceae bacterium]|nr:hypothetical protein [Acetobacteraceae bacterium]
MRKRLNPLVVIVFVILAMLLWGYRLGWYSGAQHYGIGITAVVTVLFVLLVLLLFERLS